MMTFHVEQHVWVRLQDDGIWQWRPGRVVYGESVDDGFDYYAVELGDPGDREVPERTDTLHMSATDPGLDDRGWIRTQPADLGSDLVRVIDRVESGAWDRILLRVLSAVNSRMQTEDYNDHILAGGSSDG